MDIQVKQLVLAVKQIAEEKNLPEDIVHDVIEQALAAAWRRDFGDHEMDVSAQLNTNSGEVVVTVHKTVVEAVEDEHTQISLDDAKKIKKGVKLEDVVDFTHTPKTFGRVAAQTAKQVILQKLREAEREVVLEEYSDKIGSVVTGVISRVEQRIVRVDLGRASGIMPKSEQIPGEYYSIGARIKVFLKDVERSTRGPQLILSRADERFIDYLFRNEVPEMENGAVEIKAIAREAGVRTKLAVASTVPGVDPVGTFVGGHGTRVQAVMGEVGDQEKIDIITYDEDTVKFITNALSPTEVTSVTLNEENKRATVKVAEDQLSVAIGKGGQNVRLAAKLAGYEIDIESSGGTATASSTETTKKKQPARKNIEDSLLAAVAEAENGGDETPAETAKPKPKSKSKSPESPADAKVKDEPTDQAEPTPKTAESGAEK
jgi:N utilization substance protein A